MKAAKKNITTNYVLESYRIDAITNRENRFTNVLISALFLMLTVLLFGNTVSAQSVGLNNPNPHVKSLLDLTANDKGLLTPRMTEANRLVMFSMADATAKGMLVYQTDNVQGFYVYDGTKWAFIGNEKTNWNILGNTGTNVTNNFIGSTDSVGLKFKTNNTDAINISANQKVTIGIAAPYSTLYVRGTDSSLASLTVRNLSTTGISGLWSSSSSGTLMGQAGYANSTAPWHAGNFAVGSLANVPFTLITNNIERARFDGNGNFGIDTIAPQARMHVKSNSASNWPQILVEERDSADYSRISFMNKGTNKFWTVAAHSEQVDSLSYYNVFNSSTNNLLTVRGDGNVGIGYSDPMYPLTFKSTLGDKISFWGGYGNHYGIGVQGFLLQIYAGSTFDDIAFGTGSSANLNEVMRIKGNGKVGVGTANPLQKFDVAGNINLTNDTNNIRINNIRVFTTAGANNLFAGKNAGTANTSGMGNSFVGDAAGFANTSGSYNSFSGWAAGYYNTTGHRNVFCGVAAGYVNTTGAYNTAIGTDAMHENSTGDYNTMTGFAAGYNNTTGTRNVFNGVGAGYFNTTGAWNTALGTDAMHDNTTGSYNTITGWASGYSNTTGQKNVFTGVAAGYTTTTGSWNTALGTDALRSNQTGNNNVMIGFEAGYSTTVSNNVMMGYRAGKFTSTGTNNTFIGVNAGNSNTTGSNNIAIGNNAQVATALTNAVAIGNNATATTSNTLILGGTGADAVNVGIGNNTPQHKLSFGNDLGSKISFWQSGTTNYGIGIQGYLLQYYTAAISDDHVFGYGSSTAFTENMRIKGNGDVGIGTSTPTATLEVNGYTKLGTDAPAVKMKKYTGNTAATTNGSVNFAHGLNPAKILSVDVLVSNTGGTLYPPENSPSSGAYYHYFITATAVYISNDASNSANILNRPYRVLITYEE